MSTRDRTRIVAIAKAIGFVAILVGAAWFAVAMRQWEHDRIADAVAERLRGGK